MPHDELLHGRWNHNTHDYPDVLRAAHPWMSPVATRYSVVWTKP